MNIEAIEKLIGNGNIDKAIDELVILLKDNSNDLYNNALLIKSRYSEYEITKINNTISNSEANIIFNQIVSSILGIINIYRKNSKLENEISNYAKINKLSIISFLIISSISIWKLYAIIQENITYKNELIKKEEYLKIIEIRNDEIINLASELKSDIPEFSSWIEKFQLLYLEHAEAVKNNDLSLKAEIIKQIHELGNIDIFKTYENKFQELEATIRVHEKDKKILASKLLKIQNQRDKLKRIELLNMMQHNIRPNEIWNSDKSNSSNLKINQLRREK